MRSKGFHLCVDPAWKLVTIHKPTDSWQHMPRETPPNDSGFWVGPIADLQEAQDAAQELAESRDYDVHRCKRCFQDAAR